MATKKNSTRVKHNRFDYTTLGKSKNALIRQQLNHLVFIGEGYSKRANQLRTCLSEIPLFRKKDNPHHRTMKRQKQLQKKVHKNKLKKLKASQNGN